MGPASRQGKNATYEKYASQSRVGLDLAVADIEQVAQVAEGEEADAQRQEERDRLLLHVEAEVGDDGRQRLDEERRVLEENEAAEPDRDAEDERAPSQALRTGIAHHEAEGEEQCRVADQQRKESPVAVGVEEVAACEQQEVLRPQAVREQPIRHEEGGKEDREGERVEDHATSHSATYVAGVIASASRRFHFSALAGRAVTNGTLICRATA
jgi:hypothetical protein